MTDDVSPAFDSEGKYLYFISRRTVAPEFGAFELDFQFRVTDKIYALALLDSLPSPVAPKSDEETGVAADESGNTGNSELALPMARLALPMPRLAFRT